MPERLSIEHVFGTSDERQIETLKPKPVRRKLSRWPLVVAAGALVLAAIRFELRQEFLAVHEQVVFAVALLCICLFAGRAEERLARWARARGGETGVLWCVFLFAISIAAATGILDVLRTQPAGVLERAEWLALVAVIWMASAALGSLIILLLDGMLKAFVADFRRRIIIAVLSLVTLAFSFSGFVVVRLGDFDPAAGIPALLEYLPRLSDYAKRRDLFAIGALFAAAVLALPAVISVCAKLADTVMERIIPLQRAFDRIAEGDRQVHVEEAGSPEFLSLALSFNEMVDRLYLAERIERAFGQYVSAHVLEQVRSQHGAVRLPAQQRIATVFFADIRGFTQMSERLSPQMVVDLLNRYLAQIVPIVEAHQGFLNKFIGDAVVVVFNAPIDQPDHAERSVKCAIALQQLVDQLNRHGFFPEVGELRIGIGIATGPMVCSNIGTKSRLEYTVIGDTVNLASRMTGHARAGEVWVSEETQRRLPSTRQLFAGEPIKFKGKERSVVPYRAWPLTPV